MTGLGLAALAVAVAAVVAATLAWRRVVALEARLGRRSPVPAPVDPAALQHVGLVRFRAYHDVGGDHSFALALLDGGGNGVVLNCLYHRERCRVYAKPVRAFTSPLQLTEEEMEAVGRARSDDPAIDSASLTS